MKDDFVKTYLDAMINHWRIIKEDPDPEAEHQKIAIYYIDAFQSARASLLGKVLD